MIWLFSSLFRFGFEFNLLVLGEQGLGKQTFINSLFKVDWRSFGKIRESFGEIEDVWGRVWGGLVQLVEFW